MSDIDLNELCKKYGEVVEVEEVVGVWAFHIKGCPITLRIKVSKTSSLPGMYYGLPNYDIGPYKTLHPQPTIKEALEDVLRVFLGFYDPDKAEETKYIPVENW